MMNERNYLPQMTPRAARSGLPHGSFNVLGAVCILVGTLAANAAGLGRQFNGFEVSNATVPLEEIRSGGPPRDGIPAIDRPRFVSPRAVRDLQLEDRVISVTAGGQTRAYPLRILNHHEIVNDTFGGSALAITYCPLCGTAMVFDRNMDGRRLDFGVSGLLYYSALLMYDRQTESLWSQVSMQAVSGPLVGATLSWVPSETMTWEAWRARYPGGQVLSANTGFRRDYSRNPYAGYEQSDRVAYPVPLTRAELPNKAWVTGVLVEGTAVAFPHRALAELGRVETNVAGIPIKVRFNATAGSVTVVDHRSGDPIPFVNLYWFAWQAFHPHTILWTPQTESTPIQ
jgi:hypothetical protein